MSKDKTRKRPVSKKVLARLQELQRSRGVRDLAKRFLIVCEDNKSAPNYFECLKKHFNLSATSIRDVGSGGRTQPLQVVEKAIELKDAASSESSGTEPFGETWCIIDGDYGNEINNARAKATAHNIELAISTQCFEYWVLLHFGDYDKQTRDCQGLIKELKRKGRIPGYEKGKCDFSTVVVQVHDASARAKRLRAPGIKVGELPENDNPCSEIYKLIDAILRA
jgi:hypothetical protein